MKYSRHLRFSAALLTATLLATACSSYDREEAIGDMEENGLTRAEAECVIDGMEAEFGTDKLGSNADPTPEEEQKAIDITLACMGVVGGADDAGSDDGMSEDSAGDLDTTNDVEPAVDATIYSTSDFAPVCRGTGLASAAAYVPGGAISPAVVLEGTDPDYGYSSVTLPDGWLTDFDNYSDTEIVACMNRVSATPVEVCEGYEDGDTVWAVQTFDATYEVTIRAASSAEVLATETVDAPADGCPYFSSYTPGDPTPVPDYEDPDVAMEVLLQGYIAG